MNYNVSNELNQKVDEIFHSTRRIFHIAIDESEVQYTETYTSDYGTGILIKFEDKFFLITAKHVLEMYMVEKSNNTSPFRVQVNSKSKSLELLDCLFPMKIWDIGELITDNSPYDFQDVVLVELFSDYIFEEPKSYLNLKNIDFLELHDFKDGIPLVLCGYSIDSNPYYYNPHDNEFPFNEKYTTATAINLDIIRGTLSSENNYFYFNAIDSDDKNTNGMSGGLLTCFDNGIVKIVGLHIRGSIESSKKHFIPIEKVIEAIYRYEESTCYIVDYDAYSTQHGYPLESLIIKPKSNK